MGKYYLDANIQNLMAIKDDRNWHWECPACVTICTCRACKRKKSNAQKKNMLNHQNNNNNNNNNHHHHQNNININNSNNSNNNKHINPTITQNHIRQINKKLKVSQTNISKNDHHNNNNNKNNNNLRLNPPTFQSENSMISIPTLNLSGISTNHIQQILPSINTIMTPQRQ